MMEQLPQGSLYLWMYRQGLRGVPISEILAACTRECKAVREKDVDNYWNGYHNRKLYAEQGKDLLVFPVRSMSNCDMVYSDYPAHPFVDVPEVQNRWVPCTAEGRPLIKWGKGCMALPDAKAYPGAKTFGENLKGTHLIVVDIDGDHEGVDLDLINHMMSLTCETHALRKPKDICEYEGHEGSFDSRPASFHLTYAVERVIPTMHFPWAHIDIIGNRCNSIRYWKNKLWNGLQPKVMDDTTWDYIMSYVKRRRDNAH